MSTSSERVAEDRARDCVVLDWLNKRSLGLPVSQIAHVAGVSTQKVSVATNRVVDADQAYDPNFTRDCYAWRRPIYRAQPRKGSGGK